MDRGATPLPPSAPPRADSPTEADVVPPHPLATVLRVGAVGLGLLGITAILGLIATASNAPPTSPLHQARVILVFIGAVTVGAAVSMRPDLWQAWALGTGGALLAIVGTPAHWDSFRLLFGVLAGVSLIGVLVWLAPARYRLPIASLATLFHFTGIFFATTAPPTTPWLTEQAYMRVYNPYLQFVYMRNAYHFYSPEPGPASVLVCLVKTEVEDPVTGEVTYHTKWVVFPKRPADLRDPLGLTYYRRLSLTEQVARASPGLIQPANYFEKRELLTRRQMVPIPLPQSGDEQIRQYRIPQPEVARYVLPSYASHIILANTPDKAIASKTTVKIYRLEHGMLPPELFAGTRKGAPGMSPYNPTTYQPYFLGEFDVYGNLVDPKEPMLYWLVPIAPRPPGAMLGDKGKRQYLDYMSFHALGPDVLGPDTTVDELGEDRFKDRVFDWTQLR